MTKPEARKIYDNLKPVYDTMGGDLVQACLRRGIPPELTLELMRESRESEARIVRAIALLRDDPDLPKQISDKKMKRFEKLHDDDGELKSDRTHS